MAFAPSVLNIHTPTSSFAVVHSFTQESLLDLYNKLSRKHNTDYYGGRVGPGWLKYEYNDAIWNLDDDSDYTIFTWRHQQQQQQQQQLTDHERGSAGISAWQSEVNAASASTGAPPQQQPYTQQPYTQQPYTQQRPYTPSVFSQPADATPMPATPTLYLHDPGTPLPVPPAYLNRAYYVFQPGRAGQYPDPAARSRSRAASSTGRRSARKSVRSARARAGAGVGVGDDDEDGDDGVPRFKKQFERFHAENGVRTVMGSIGPVHNVRMLLKTGYRHVYMSRKFAAQHGFIPRDAAPGSYGYGGLVNLGMWPITLVQSAAQPGHPTHPTHAPAAGAAGASSSALGAGAGGYQRPDAFPTPVSSPGRTAHTLPAHEQGAPSRLAPPMTSGKTRSLRSATTASGKGKGGSRRRGPADAPGGPTVTTIEVYLSEEPHFDIVLGRSFIEKRRIQMNNVDPTDVVCLDTGEKIECELVILKDGRGEIVTVT